MKKGLTITNVRISDHNLLTEKDWHYFLIRENRICLFCIVIEDANIFFVLCANNADLRNTFILLIFEEFSIKHINLDGNENQHPYNRKSRLLHWEVSITEDRELIIYIYYMYKIIVHWYVLALTDLYLFVCHASVGSKGNKILNFTWKRKINYYHMWWKVINIMTSQIPFAIKYCGIRLLYLYHSDIVFLPDTIS